MKLSIKGLAVAAALLWGGVVLFVGLIGTFTLEEGAKGAYGGDFMLMLASIYPGYHGRPELGDTIVGALYALVDGAIGGALLAWLYNLVTRGESSSSGS